jgi:undecaprenyl-diphosphatase
MTATRTTGRTARRLGTTLAGLVLLGWAMGLLVLHSFGGFFHQTMDRPVNRWLHSHHSGIATTALGRVSHLGSAPVVLAVALAAGAAAAAWRRSRAPLVALALAYGGATAITLAVKLAVGRGRSEVHAGLGGIAQLAFPSGHATLTAAVYGAGAVLVARSLAGARTRGGRRLRAAAAAMLLGLVLAVGVSRVYLGVHDATDVLAGWTLGGLWALAVTFRA